ncbi:hypothetical protein MUK42_18111 [Musa troglodytarum]|uniref:Uncharacterized protein n=1 Tax=Musa troglodytarum TaxID=320322 RepID=A0A9E7KTA7_9LILI|nr:hypothetical protein MUK42_18111 [Musa troglodytarum]
MMASVDTKQRPASLPGVERGLFVATLIRREESVSERSEDEHLPCHPCVQVMRNSNAQGLRRYDSNTMEDMVLTGGGRRGGCQSQSAPALRSSGTSLPPRWSAMTSSVGPTRLPPMKTAGTGGLRPSILASARSMSFPLGSSSSSWTAGFTPSSQKSRLTVWHMQQELRLKTTTALCEANLLTLSIPATGSWYR